MMKYYNLTLLTAAIRFITDNQATTDSILPEILRYREVKKS